MRKSALLLVMVALLPLSLAGCAISDYGAAGDENDRLRVQLDATTKDLQRANERLSALGVTYPPRGFGSRVALESWLAADDTSNLRETEDLEGWMSRAYRVQRNAAKDGYLVSIDYDSNGRGDMLWVACTTIIDGIVYFWDPETDQVDFDRSLDLIEVEDAAAVTN